MDQDWSVITTPTFEWLATAIRQCKSRLLIGCPYVGQPLVELNRMAATRVKRTLITRTDFRDFAVRASSLEALCQLSQEGVDVMTLSGIHAKVYVMDDVAALVTSANVTHSGMYRNLECGLATRNPRVVMELSRSVLSGFGSSIKPKRTLQKTLIELRTALDATNYPAASANATNYQPDDFPGDRSSFIVSDPEELLAGFRGWLRLTLTGALKLPEAGFGVEDLYSVCREPAADQYPNNHTVRDKLRQQLQYLRDFGLIESPSRGRYRLTISL